MSWVREWNTEDLNKTLPSSRSLLSVRTTEGTQGSRVGSTGTLRPDLLKDTFSGCTEKPGVPPGSWSPSGRGEVSPLSKCLPAWRSYPPSSSVGSPSPPYRCTGYVPTSRPRLLRTCVDTGYRPRSSWTVRPPGPHCQSKTWWSPSTSSTRRTSSTPSESPTPGVPPQVHRNTRLVFDLSRVPDHG